MSDHNNEKDVGPKKSRNEDHTAANRSPDIENFNKADAVLSTIKNNTSAEEVVIKVNNLTPDSDFGKHYENKEYSLFAYKQKRPSTWVMYQEMPMQQHTYPPDSQPLSYDSSRNDFVRLVFTIVLVMILVTAALVAIVLFQPDVNDIFHEYGLFLVIPATVIMIGLSYAVACSACARVFPCNIVILVLSVICMSIICGYITSRYRTEIVLYAVLATSVVVIVCIILACTRFDFTKFMLYIVVASVAFGAVAMIVMLAMLLTGTYMKIVHLIILLVSTLLNSVVLVMELQMILGGRAIEIGEEEYALAAFMLYTSIIDMFLKLVQIIGIFDDM